METQVSTQDTYSAGRDIPHSPRYLDYKGILAHLGALGFPIKDSQLRCWLNDKRLPVFKLAGKFYIEQNVLENHFHSMQTQAVKELDGGSKESRLEVRGKQKSRMGVNILRR